VFVGLTANENLAFYKFAKDIKPEPPILEISMEEAVEELSKIRKQKVRIK